VELAARLMVSGVDFDHDRLFYDTDPVYRLLLNASLNRAVEIQKRLDQERVEQQRANA
jgi:hypothetical protein